MLSRDQPGELPAESVFREGGGGGLRTHAGGGGGAVWLADPRVRGDEQPLSPRGGAGGAKPERGDEVAAGDVDPAGEPVPRADRTALPRPVQGAAGRAGSRVGAGMPLHPSQSGASQAASAGGKRAVPVEQFAEADPAAGAAVADRGNGLATSRRSAGHEGGLAALPAVPGVCRHRRGEEEGAGGRAVKPRLVHWRTGV